MLSPHPPPTPKNADAAFKANWQILTELWAQRGKGWKYETLVMISLPLSLF